MLELSSYQLDLTRDRALRRRGAAQHHARPSRPPWRHGRLCRRQETHLRHQRRGRYGRDRRRRRSAPRAIADQLQTSSRGRGRPSLGGAALEHGGVCDRRPCCIDAPRAGRRAVASICGRSPRLTRRAQLAERGRGLCGGRARLRRRRRGHRHAAIATLPGPARTGMERSRAVRRRALRQRQQGHQRRRRARSALACYRPYLLDRRRQAQGRRHRSAAPLLAAHPPCLSDRRGGAALRQRRSAARCRAPHAATLDDRGRQAAADARPGPSRRGGAALAGLRLVRPVRDFEDRGDAFKALVAKLAEPAPVRATAAAASALGGRR